jgi:hypothetical protein
MFKHRLLFTWLLPLIWTSVAAVNFRYPGDEYGGFGLGSLPGLWILLVTGPISDINRLLAPVLLTGAATMSVAGLLLDRLRVSMAAWSALTVVFGGLICWYWLQTFPSWERAMGKNGSLLAYLLPSFNAGLAASTVVLAATMPIYRIAASRHWLPSRDNTVNNDSSRL